MSSQDVATLERPTRALSLDKPARDLKPTGKLKAALDLMVFGPAEGEDIGIAMGWLDAARACHYNAAAMRKSLNRPHVQRYLREQKQVFRASASAQNISHLVRMRDSSGNAMAQLGAIKVLEQIDDDPATSAARNHAPGVVIVIAPGSPVMAHNRSIEAKPLIEHDAVSAKPTKLRNPGPIEGDE